MQLSSVVLGRARHFSASSTMNVHSEDEATRLSPPLPEETMGPQSSYPNHRTGEHSGPGGKRARLPSADDKALNLSYAGKNGAPTASCVLREQEPQLCLSKTREGQGLQVQPEPYTHYFLQNHSKSDAVSGGKKTEASVMGPGFQEHQSRMVSGTFQTFPEGFHKASGAQKAREREGSRRPPRLWSQPSRCQPGPGPALLTVRVLSPAPLHGMFLLQSQWLRGGQTPQLL